MASRYACPPPLSLPRPHPGRHGTVFGDQMPRIALLAAGADAPEAPITGQFVALGEACGIHLLPWERWVLGQLLRRTPDGAWENPELWLLVCRRNGKNVILKVLEIGLILLVPEVTRINHSAHELKTAKDHLMELWRHLANLGPAFFTANKIQHRTANDDPSLIFEVDGIPKRIRAIARTNDGGRGQECEVLVLDEALKLTPPQVAALTPLTMAVPDPLVVYSSSAAYEEGEVLNRTRRDVLAGRATAGDLAWLEWSAPPGTASDDEAGIRAGNPSLGWLFGLDRIDRQRRAMAADPRKFRVEHLGLLDEAETDPPKIDPPVWDALRAEPGEVFPEGTVSVGVDRSPKGTETALVVAAERADSRVQVEVVRIEPGDPVAWVPEQVAWIGDRHYVKTVVIDAKSSAAVLVEPLRKAGYEVHLTGLPDMNVACQQLVDHVAADRLRHPADPALTAAATTARERITNTDTLAWAWARENARASITPLVAATLAVWGLSSSKAKRATRKREPRPPADLADPASSSGPSAGVEPWRVLAW